MAPNTQGGISRALEQFSYQVTEWSGSRKPQLQTQSSFEFRRTYLLLTGEVQQSTIRR
ncbi:MAG TPA: hypothetical protein VN920_16230 [Pyrinomonadaceae bacterium]|nr:hypothetical protein [Pyrinomonadaceae bacterium]